jgi:hypothetical protein
MKHITPTMFGPALIAGLLFTLAIATPASPRPVPPRDDFVVPPWSRMSVGLEVLVDGKPLPTIHHEGKVYLPVPELGRRYAIRVRNRGSRRIVAIVSVDGLSVISGRVASENSPGYLVSPHNSIVIKGWRRNLQTVAAFRFTERDKSYASLMGHSENVGVIGLVAFEEQVPWPRPLAEKRQAAAPGADRMQHGKVGSTGTEYGEDIGSRAYYVPFVRSSNRRSVTLYYDTVEALRNAGVPVDVSYPVPFPGDTGFAPPPPHR